MESTYILVIEDDDIVARTIERSLRGNEFRVVVANSGVEGLKFARRRPPDLVILDIIMPGMDGYAVCREMRSDPLLADTPILFLTAKSKDEDKISGFTAGADDYLCKPFNIDELILRLRAILRRANQGAGLRPGAGEHELRSASQPLGARLADQGAVEMRQRLEVGGFMLDTRSYELTTPSRGKVRLTPVQFELLLHLMSHPGEIFSPSRLLDEVWDYPSDTGSPDLVRVHIKNLRERIETDPHAPQFIQTVPGYGYTISAV
ncbi:MAG: response regulator transcription factor [Anaerolineales bacterium]|nr:response regulator transcription factor [Anaerolineales bacterium]